MAARWMLFLLFYWVLSCGETSHFRGAIIMFRTLDDLTEEQAREHGVRALIVHRIGWRRSYSDGTYCDADTIEEGTKLLSEGRADLTCRIGCRGDLADMTFYCTDFSESEDWSYGENNVEVILPYDGDGIVEASFANTAWIGLTTGGGRWELRLSINFTHIITTKGGNASPISKMAPVLRLQHGCNHTIQVPIEDADGDDVRCRWATRARGECAGVCQTFPGAELQERSCTLHYVANGLTGYYAVALQIEDFIDPVDNVALSSVPLQFLVYVYDSTESCYSKPQFASPPTRPDDSCVGVPQNGTFFENLVAKVGGPGLSIEDIGTQSPPGMQKSDLGVYGDGKWYVNVTWIPTDQQYGPNVFCYVAKDNTQRTSDQVCITILGGVSPPRVLPRSMSPTGIIHPEHQSWQIEFDREIFRPTRSSFVRFHDSLGRDVLMVDTATSSAVTFPDPDVSNVLQIQTNFRFIEKSRYYVTLDNGVVVGKEFCGPESTVEMDEQFWSLEIRDVTPPLIQFRDSPDYTNANVTITWSFDEVATTACVLQSPGQNSKSVVCNKSFAADNLAEGYHTLFIQASDSEGNSAQYQHRWFVDVTKPTIAIINPPNIFSNKTDYTFHMRCIDRSTCVYICRSHPSDVQGEYGECGSTFTTAILQETEYTFNAYAIDRVGNVGTEVVYRWSVDTHAPHIQALNNKTVFCGDPTLPTILGYPEVTDNFDTNPVVTYVDKNMAGCMTERVWTATDDAGNHASYTQSISFSSPIAPYVYGDNPLFVACGNTDSLLFNPDEVKGALNITHLCSREVVTSFVDSRPVDACGIELTRSWTVTDDCGEVTLFNQDIRVLKQSYPILPENGQQNVPVTSELIWPQYPGATEYSVYIWQQDGLEPVTATQDGLSSRSYIPSVPYPPNTPMLWRIGYTVLSADGISTEVPSPNWGFTTKAFPDLSVTSIQIPEEVFSGSAFSMSWRVENIGNVSTSASSNRWYDGIYLSLDADERPTQWTKSLRQHRFLDANDGYIAEADVQLADEEIGNFFVTVSADIYQHVQDDYNRMNNILQANIPIEVKLTPPPNLEVIDVLTLGNSFSGQPTTVRWTIINSGIGITGVDKWIDAIFLSVDTELNQGDELLHRESHTGALISGAEYEFTATVYIPNAIYGSFFFIVQTDIFQQVYEHASEDDNTNTASIEIRLSPTPDFILQAMYVVDSAVTGDRLQIEYIVKNVGAGSPFERWWTDKVSLVSENNGQIYYTGKSTHTPPMSPGTTYSYSFFYVIPSHMPTGLYNISIKTDSRNQIFEFDAENNNWRSKRVNIQQVLPNLDVIRKSHHITENTTGNYLDIEILVSNSGEGNIVDVISEDLLFITLAQIVATDVIQPLHRVTRSSDLRNGESYQMETPITFEIPPEYIGNLYLYVKLDSANVVHESNENDNFVYIGTSEVSRRAADLLITTGRLDTTYAIAGQSITLTWVVQNAGNLALQSTKWDDSIYISRDSNPSNGMILHNQPISVSSPMQPGMEYTRTNIINLPITITGSLKLIVATGQRQNGYEENKKNNIYTIDIQVDLPPTPDIMVQDVSHQFVAAPGTNVRIISITYTVKNSGNTMSAALRWVDRIRLAASASEHPRNMIQTMETRNQALVASETYTVTKLMTIPPHIFGYYQLTISLDLLDNISELNGENDNEWRLTRPILIDRFPMPLMQTELDSTLLPKNLQGGTKVQVMYTVTNTDGAKLPVSSWTDAVFLYGIPGASRQHVLSSGTRTGHILQNRELAIGDAYFSTIHTTVPHGISGDYYTYIIIDVNNKLRIAHGNPDHSTQPLNVTEGPLPDIEVSLTLGDGQTQSGDILDITFNVTNMGMSSLEELWYDTIYLSEDPDIDPFDFTLKSLSRPNPLMTNEYYLQTTGILIPFDLAASVYYIMVQVNSDQRVFESDYDNNIAAHVVSIRNSPAVDLITHNVQQSHTEATYKDDVTFNWDITNNGSFEATGYKCDMVYISDDEVWDITDQVVAEPGCDRFTLAAKDDPRNTNPYQTIAPIPFVAEGSYKAIVKSRNNIPDYNTDNNVGVSTQNVTIGPLTIGMNQKMSYLVTENSDMVLKVTDIPIGIALLVRLETSYQHAYHMLYLKHRQPPRQYNYDAISDERMTTNQFVVVPFTKSSDYYLLVNTIGFGTTTYSIDIEVKEAKFEVTSVFPSQVNPSGTSTLRISGMLFGQNLQACIRPDSSILSPTCSDKVIRFGSNMAYATFYMQDSEIGQYSLFLHDLATIETAEKLSAVHVKQDALGKLAIDATMPGTLRAGSEGLVRLHIQNVGYNDVEVPVLAVQFAGGSASVKMADTASLMPPMQFYPFIPNVAKQPITVIPPRANRQFQIHIHSTNVGREALRITQVGEPQIRGYIAMLKNLLKPPTIRKVLWNRIWNNVDHCLGSDVESMIHRITSVMEIVNRKSTIRYGFVEIMNQLSLIADGRLGASIIVQYADISDITSPSAQDLTFERAYSSALSVRQRIGPMGRGWVIPALEKRLLTRQTGELLLDINRIVYNFQRETGYYYCPSLPNDMIVEEENYYKYITDGLYYNFRKQTGRLVVYGVSGTERNITLEYASNKVQTLTADSGSRIHITYNPHNLIRYVRLQSPAGEMLGESSYEYSADNLLESVKIGTKVSKYEYEDGDLSAIQYATGIRQEIAYDETTGWLSGVSLLQHGRNIGRSEFELHCDGKLKVTTHPENITSEFLFGFGGVLAEQKPPTGSPLTVERDPIRRRENLYIGDQLVAARSYDPDTRIFTQTDGNGDILELNLNENGDTTSASTSLGILYQNEVRNDQLISTMFPDGTNEAYEYSKNGRIKQRILRDNTIVAYEFDEQDNLIMKSGHKGSSFYVYDENQKLTEIQNVEGTTRITYGHHGLPSVVVYPDGTELRYVYNTMLLRTRLSTNTGYDVHYTYDNAYRLTSISDGQGNTLSDFTYKNGKLIKNTRGNGIYTSYSFQDGTLRLSDLQNVHSNDSVISTFSYSYDEHGYLVSAVTHDGTWRYEYDAAGQLIDWDSPFGQGEHLTYDANLNRVTKTAKGSVPEAYQKNNLGQVTSYGQNEKYTYNNNGDMVQKVRMDGDTEIAEVYNFDQEGRVTFTDNEDTACEYSYDAFGSISRKTCANGVLIKYTVDPFGPFGANVIAESTSGDANFMYYANEPGLVAEKSVETGDIRYFIYDGDGSVQYISDEVGIVSGGYSYDPFGNQINGPTNMNTFGYLGQLGVMKFKEGKNMYSMKARIYDTEHGRFISSDPLGYLGDSRNLYIYAKNNPLSYKDPNGEFTHIIGGTIIGGVTGALFNAGSQAFSIGFGDQSWSDFSWSEVGGAAVSGAITGAAVTSGAILGGVGGAALTTAGGFVGGASGSITSDALGGNPINIRDALISGTINAPAALIPWRMIGYKGKGASAFGSKHMIRPKIKTTLDPRRATGKTLWKSLGLGSAVGELASNLLGDLLSDPPSLDDIKDWGKDLKDWADDLANDIGDWLDETSDDIGEWWDDFTDDLDDWWDDISDDLRDWWDEFNDDLSDWGDNIGEWWQDWIRSRDPNDIIGPTGYGDGHFIASGIAMDYKIRFENDENATAPAQKVTVRCPLDDDLDVSTFRLGSFGFGSFELNLDYNSPIYQQMVNATVDSGTFVYFQAGVDILKKEGYWLLQSIDPETGLPPTDPTIGFLPPNNKSTGSGEGFVTFRIMQKDNIPDGSIVDAQASIIFDENAPIDTPPIFNTIDRSWPNASFKINNDLKDSAGVLVTVNVEENGSGTKEVDFFTITATGDAQPLLSGINQSIVSLAVEAGITHKIIIVATDNVGNSEPLNTLDYTEISYFVDCPNNCSNKGMCQSNGHCVCSGSYHGGDCSSDQAVLEPPILDVSAEYSMEDKPVFINLKARSVKAMSGSDTLDILIRGYPAGSSFNKGSINDDVLAVSQKDFGIVRLNLPEDFSGTFTLLLMAQLMVGTQSVSREGSLTIHIAPVVDIPNLSVTVDCYNQSKPTILRISASVSDQDGSEQLVSVGVTDIPDFVKIKGIEFQNGYANLPLGEHTLVIQGEFRAFSLNIRATASEANFTDTNVVSERVDVQKCKKSTSSAATLPFEITLFISMCMVVYTIN